MPRIHFASGKFLTISEDEFKKISVKLQYKGIRIQPIKSTGDLIPLNSSTIEFIEAHPDDEVQEPEWDEMMNVKEPEPDMTPVPTEPDPAGEPGETPRVKTKEEKIADVQEDFMARASCQHEDAKMQLGVRHTKAGTRYMPYCTFCGKRERFVSLKKIQEGKAGRWTIEDVQNAKILAEV